jgi:hypothetical protein
VRGVSSGGTLAVDSPARLVTRTSPADADVEIHFDGPAKMGTTANYFRVTPGYLRVMQIPLIRGRLITGAGHGYESAGCAHQRNNGAPLLPR